MAKLHCPISGITYQVEHSPITLKLPHPIFSLPYKKLLGLYSKHIQGHLTATDSYLLFLAYLNSIESLEWRVPCSLVPTAKSTQQLIANNLKQLLEVLTDTHAITVPSFKQPGYVIDTSNSNLENIPIYIQAWRNNLVAFENNYFQQKLDSKIAKEEEKLQYLINKGEDRLTAIRIAEWADLSASFPHANKDNYKRIIRCCYNQEKIFSIPLADIISLKEFCLANILPGSIYHHKLIEILNHGIDSHKNFLGYTLLPSLDSTENDNSARELDILISKAPAEPPSLTDYPTRVEYLKAKIRYMLATRNLGES